MEPIITSYISFVSTSLSFRERVTVYGAPPNGFLTIILGGLEADFTGLGL
jgi:hypothetical protein